MFKLEPPLSIDRIILIYLGGRHSKIPECCIYWFLFRLRLPSWWKEFSIRYFGKKLPIEKGYVRCPLCLIKGRRVSIHLCSAECHGELGHCKSYQCSICKEERKRR